MFKRRPNGKGDASRPSEIVSPARHVGTAVSKVGESAMVVFERLRGLLDGAEQAHPDRVDELRTMRDYRAVASRWTLKVFRSVGGLPVGQPPTPHRHSGSPRRLLLGAILQRRGQLLALLTA